MVCHLNLCATVMKKRGKVLWMELRRDCANLFIRIGTESLLGGNRSRGMLHSDAYQKCMVTFFVLTRRTVSRKCNYQNV